MLCLSFYIFNCIFAATPTRNVHTPDGTSNFSVVTRITPSYSGNMKEVISEFFKDDKISFQENTQQVPGENHLSTGFLTFFNERIFCMQRRYDDYGENPPFCPIDPANNTAPFSEKLVQAIDVLNKTRIVPLIERILQTETVQKSSETQKEAIQIQRYIEFYPYVEGIDGAIWLKDVLRRESYEVAYPIMQLMGLQVGHMFANGIPHTDCHPANFLINANDFVFAIDCRDRMRALDRKNPTPPALLFLGVMAGIIRQTLGERIKEPELLDKNYTKIFTKYRQVFIEGMKEGVGANTPGEAQRHSWIPLEMLTDITNPLVSEDFSKDNDFSGKALAITEQIARLYFQEIGSTLVSASASPQAKRRPKPEEFNHSDDDDFTFQDQQQARDDSFHNSGFAAAGYSFNADPKFFEDQADD